MTKYFTILGLAGVLAVAGYFASAQSAEKQGKAVIFAAADDAKFKEVIPGVSRAALWGNSDKGPFGRFTKFKPGMDAGLHTHTNDLWLVVIKGAYLYKDDAGEKRVGPGGFIRIPGKLKHWSGGDAKEGALFYEESYGKFDLIPVK
ncbi:MAG TPA: cupin domain-containing protein [Candidatus Binatia bacterium]